MSKESNLELKVGAFVLVAFIQLAKGKPVTRVLNDETL